MNSHGTGERIRRHISRIVRSPALSSVFGRQVCPFPFVHLELDGSGRFIPCCRGWLTDEILKQKDLPEDPWNSPTAAQLRSRIWNGDFSRCRRELCHARLFPSRFLNHVSSVGLARWFFEKFFVRIPFQPLPAVEDGPAYVTLAGDPRCNLACRSCRSAHCQDLTAPDREAMALIERHLERYQGSIRFLKFASSGEALFSDWYRNIIRGCTRERFPKLEGLILHTNGLLANRDTFEALKPGSDWIRQVIVSVDAGTAEAYREVRGAKWDVLVKNLEWLSGELSRKRIIHLRLMFTACRNNFRTLPQFLELGRRLNVSRMTVNGIEPWESMAYPDFQREAVHLSGHPEHEEFLTVLKTLRNEPNVDLCL